MSDAIVYSCSTGIRTLYWWALCLRTKHYAVFSGGRYCLYWAIRSILRGSILLILGNTNYFEGVDNPDTKKYAIFSGVDTAYIKRYTVFLVDRYCIYWAIRSIFCESILHILSNTQFVEGVDTSYTKQYAIFSGVDTKRYWCILNKKH